MKEHYDSPSLKEIYVDTETVFSASGLRGSNSINAWGDGGTTTDEVIM